MMNRITVGEKAFMIINDVTLKAKLFVSCFTSKETAAALATA
jgi:hypothetical protein